MRSIIEKNRIMRPGDCLHDAFCRVHPAERGENPASGSGFYGAFRGKGAGAAAAGD